MTNNCRRDIEKSIFGRAIEYYEKYIDLWKDADPGIAEVEDAKERMVGLEEEEK